MSVAAGFSLRVARSAGTGNHKDTKGTKITKDPSVLFVSSCLGGSVSPGPVGSHGSEGDEPLPYVSKEAVLPIAGCWARKLRPAVGRCGGRLPDE